MSSSIHRLWLHIQLIFCRCTGDSCGQCRDNNFRSIKIMSHDTTKSSGPSRSAITGALHCFSLEYGKLLLVHLPTHMFVLLSQKGEGFAILEKFLINLPGAFVIPNGMTVNLKVPISGSNAVFGAPHGDALESDRRGILNSRTGVNLMQDFLENTFRDITDNSMSSASLSSALIHEVIRILFLASRLGLQKILAVRRKGM
ncbi:hypothetical protein Tco_0017388 [Tanacetum coccineum]